MEKRKDLEVIKNPKYTFAIPVYNGISFLRKNLDSILKQKVPDFEICVSDGGSIDGSQEFILGISDSRLRFQFSEEKISMAENWNRVSRMARGEFVVVLGQDDECLPSMLDTYEELTQHFSDVSIFVTRRSIVNGCGNLRITRRQNFPTNTALKGEDILRKCGIKGKNLIGEPVFVLFRREILLNSLPWNDSLPYVIDLEFYARSFVNSKVVFSKHVSSSFRIHSKQLTRELEEHQSAQLYQLLNESEVFNIVQANRWRRFMIHTRIKVASKLRILVVRVFNSKVWEFRDASKA